MYAPRMKTLENSAHAAGSAFGFDEADFDVKFIAPVHHGRLAAMLLAIGGGVIALAHHFGWTSVVATLGGWRAA